MTEIQVPKDVQNMIEQLENKGYTAYIVGGCVRDAIMGKPPHDYDICTSATPDEMKEVFKEYDVIETGLKHGTLTVKGEDDFYEITTYRIDTEYKDNRHPDKVIFVDDIEKDLARRDFTINAMAYNKKTGLIDPFGGEKDIRDRVIRCVGNPDKRFNEDGLRIMRAIRFASVCKFNIDKDTENSIHKNKNLLNNISQERITSEFCKMLITADFNLLNNYKDIIGEIIPEMKQTFDFEQYNYHHLYNVYEHIIHSVDNAPNNLIIRLSLFFHDIGKPSCFSLDENGVGHFYSHSKASKEITEKVMREMKFDNKSVKTVCELVGNHDIIPTDSKKFVRKMLNKLGKEQTERLLTVEECDKKAQTINKDSLETFRIITNVREKINEVIEEENCFSLKDLAINGNDLKNIGIKEGKEIGIILNLLLENVLENPENNSREKLLKIAENLKEKIEER